MQNNAVNMQDQIIKYSVVSLIKQNSQLLLIFAVAAFLSTSEIWLHKKFLWKRKML